MKHSAVETLVGFLVILVATGFFIFAYNTSNVAKAANSYAIFANFQNIDGITDGADVKLSGIKVGYVENVTLEEETYFATVKLRIDSNVDIPKDSRAIVSTSGLLGGKYIRINPGPSDYNIPDSGKIIFTQSALNIEDLIAKLMYSLTSK
ncbi:MAG: outer membrane lipid asymmetry maintenance protein MlaD [Rickettsiales bacterium]|nr:MAG: outer membrane lipid asymmetry maintenance protein MlaD [Rickettsiales bacterium]